MTAEIAAETKGDGERKPKFTGASADIINRKHDVIFLIGGSIRGNKVEISQKIFGRFQLYYNQPGFRCCSGKIIRQIL